MEALQFSLITVKDCAAIIKAVTTTCANTVWARNAFSAVANWALYHVRMNRVVVKRFKENVTFYKNFHLRKLV